MQAIISGSAAIAYVRSSPPTIIDIDGLARTEAYSESDIAYLFAGATDVSEGDYRTADDVFDDLKRAWAIDRALRFTLFLFDPGEPDEEDAEIAACLEELLEIKGVCPALVSRLFCDALPGPYDIERVKAAARPYVLLSSLIDDLLRHQSAILATSQSFDVVAEELFGGSEAKEAIRSALIQRGAWRQVAQAVAQGQSLQFLKLQLTHDFRAAKDGVGLWLAKLQPGLKPVKSRDLGPSDAEAPDNWRDDDAGPAGHAAFANAQAQIKGIVERLQAHDTAAAGRFAASLIENQKGNSSGEYLAKTLSNLSQQAKLVEEYELQLTWAEQSYRAAPTDLVAAGHLVDAYLNNDKIVEAHQLINQIEAQGGQRYAITAKARILRMEGDFVSARELYLKALELFPDDEDTWRSASAAAECLKDMNNAEGALVEYERAILRWPHELMLLSGKASALMALGRFDEAATAFKGAARSDRERHVAQNGRATALRHSGKFKHALSEYDEAIRSLPGDPISLSGRAEVLRDMGDLEEALLAYEEMRGLIPSSRQSWIGYASVLKELGRFREAEKAYREGLALHEGDERLTVGLAYLLQRTGRTDEALILFDDLTSKHPFNAYAKLGRADTLKRKGRLIEAAQEIDLILRDTPEFQLALTAKAALLIAQDRTSEALSILPAHPPVSQTDWDRFVLRVIATRQRAGTAQALRLAEPQLQRVPFARQKRLLSSLLASMKLERGRVNEAYKMAQFRPGEASNVIFFHVLAADRKRAGRAEEIYHELKKSEAPDNLIVLADELARRFKLVPQEPRHSLPWIFEQERSALLLEIA